MVKDKKDDVKYNKVTSMVCDGDKSIDLEKAKKLLGWTPETKNRPVKEPIPLLDIEGRKVECVNNKSNRPLRKALLALYKQEHLNRRWLLNGESLIIGKRGGVLNGQHTLISFILACEELESNRTKWKHIWGDDTLFLQKVVVVGIDENDVIVNSLDTGKSRTLSDVLYRSDHFKEYKPKQRVKVARYCENAIKLLWHRTGAKKDAYAPRRSHVGSMEFIETHPKVLDAVAHIHGEVEAGTSNILTPGYSAGMMYLMSCSTSDPKVYYGSDTKTEELLNHESWGDAETFWTLVLGREKRFKPLYEVAADLRNKGCGHVESMSALIAKAWDCYIGKEKITAESLTLLLNKDESDADGYIDYTLAECPTVGGIDLGEPAGLDDVIGPPTSPPKATKTPKAIPTTSTTSKPSTPRKKVGAKKGSKTKTGVDVVRLSKAKQATEGNWTKGDVCWVTPTDVDEKPYLGLLVDEPYTPTGKEPRVLVQENRTDKEWDLAVADIGLKRPESK